MASEWIKARQTRYGAYLTLYIAVICCVLFAINYLAKIQNKSFDTTANKRYTLSDETVKAVGNLKSPVTIYYFDRKGSYAGARELLDRYQNLSSKVSVKYIDLVERPDIAKAEGAHRGGDIVVDSGTKKEQAQSLTEEQITNAIVRDEKGDARNACFIEGSEEHRIDDTGTEGYSALKEAIEKKNFKAMHISLLEKPEIPSNCSLVIVGGPRHDYVPAALSALKAYVEGGGHALFNFDAVANDNDGKMGDTPALAALVQNWGITPGQNLVLDISQFGMTRGPINVPVVEYESHAIVRVMAGNASVFRFARTLDVKSPGEKLFSSTSASFAATSVTLPIEGFDPSKAKQGPFVLGAVATIGSGSKAGRVVVVGSSLWIANGLLNAPYGNRDLMLNMMNWLAGDEDLITIHAKDPEDRRLRLPSGGRFFWISVVLIPLAVILSGVSVWWNRR